MKLGLTCNIDARGKRSRLIIGLLFLFTAILAGIWACLHPSPIILIITAVMAIAGGFCVFESLAGWCAVRALGFKTRV
jgi:hypothetical protein